MKSMFIVNEYIDFSWRSLLVPPWNNENQNDTRKVRGQLNTGQIIMINVKTVLDTRNYGNIVVDSTGRREELFFFIEI